MEFLVLMAWVWISVQLGDDEWTVLNLPPPSGGCIVEVARSHPLRSDQDHLTHKRKFAGVLMTVSGSASTRSTTNNSGVKRDEQ